jgi:hypothetical protein
MSRCPICRRTRRHRHYPRDERIILHGLKHIGVMETPENVVDEDGGDEALEHS